MGRSERAVATDNDECVEAISFYAAHHRRNAAVVFLRVEAGASQYRAAALQDALRLIRRQRREFVLDNAAPSVVKSEEFVAVRRPRANGGANRGVETRAVTPARQQTDPHGTPIRVLSLKSVAEEAPKG